MARPVTSWNDGSYHWGLCPPLFADEGVADCGRRGRRAWWRAQAQFQAIAESRRSIVRTAFGFLPGAGGSDAEAAR
jgi:hypothetical protein